MPPAVSSQSKRRHVSTTPQVDELEEAAAQFTSDIAAIGKVFADTLREEDSHDRGEYGEEWGGEWERGRAASVIDSQC